MLLMEWFSSRPSCIVMGILFPTRLTTIQVLTCTPCFPASLIASSAFFLIAILPWTYFFQKRYDKAVIAFGQAHTFDKKNTTSLIGMGWCYFSLKEYEKALEAGTIDLL